MQQQCQLLLAKLSRQGRLIDDVRRVLDEVRFGLATEYLVETPLPVQDVASLLGYSDPGKFTHAFKRWAGTSPSDFRLARQSITSPRLIHR